SLPDKDRSQLRDIERIWIRNTRGELVRLSEVTRVLEKPTLITIQRENRERSINIFGNIAPGKSQAEAIAFAQQAAKETLPEGYRLVLSGSAESFKQSFRELSFALILGIVIAYMILGAQFNSFIHPFTVLLALPFSISGAFLGLTLTGHSLNMMSMIGILLLMGIVKKNSILLVDFTNARRAAGMNLKEAILEACPLRLRPILMTSLAIIAGALPAAIALGPGAELRAPMAVAVIGGTIVSTLLTLLVVPCAYSLLARLEPASKQKRYSEVTEILAEIARSGR
ncbi:MAG: efflux RND transporter permease subunit, partial [Elusimicrobiota bacterium]